MAEPKQEKKTPLPSPELAFWSLFSAGGTVAAFLFPVHIAILGIALGLGWLPDDALSYDRVLALVRHPLTKLYLAVLVILPLFHWAHRFRFTIHHELGIHGGREHIAVACYGTALVGAALTVWVLVLI
jgi:fumarate reductase subunit D